MKFFVDTADTAEIAELAETGLLDGVTTNPSLIHKSGRDFMEVTKEICGLVDGPVSAEVVALDHAGMMREAEILRKIADRSTIAWSLPSPPDSAACRASSVWLRPAQRQRRPGQKSRRDASGPTTPR